MTKEESPSADPEIQPSHLSPLETEAAVPMPREWKSCCFRISPPCATFSVQVLFSGFLILFAAYKLAQTGAPDPLYVSLLTWCPYASPHVTERPPRWTQRGTWRIYRRVPSPVHAHRSRNARLTNGIDVETYLRGRGVEWGKI